MKKAAQKAPPKKALSTSPGELVCVVCQKAFTRAANNRVKAKVCTPFHFEHVRRKERLPDGSVKEHPCECCRCIYKLTLAKRRSLEGKVLPINRIKEFLATAQKMYGDEVALAFRTALNAMLRVKEIRNLEAKNLDANAKPLPQLHVVALKKKVKVPYPVDIDPDMASALVKHLGGNTEGPIFDIPVRTLQHKFKQVVRSMGIPNFTIHSLRHTGIYNRAQGVTNLNELEYIRRQARHESIETTKLYLGLEARERLEMSKRIKWF